MADRSPTEARTAAAPASGAAAESRAGEAPRAPLDAALARILPFVTHDQRNGLGIVSVQLEALQLRAFGPRADEAAAARHGDAAAAGIERLAAQLDALGAFARGDEAPLAVLAREAAALVPTRHVACEGDEGDGRPALPATLLRAAVLELLCHALGAAGPWSLRVDPAGNGRCRLTVTAGRPLGCPPAAEWLVQVEAAGAHLDAVDGALVLSCPAA